MANFSWCNQRCFDSNDALEEFDVEFQYQYLDANKAGNSSTNSVSYANTAIGFLSNKVLD